jgi:hypothetical protein
MRIPALAAGLVAISLAMPASAGPLLDTLHSTPAPNATRATVPGGALLRGGPLAMEFDATGGTINQIQLQLNANAPSDGGAVSVYIVPNAPGGNLAGDHPALSGSGSTLTLTNADAGHLIGTIADASLVTAGTGNTSATVTLPASFAVTPGEYWLVVENTATDTAKWVFDSTAYTGSTGITGQSTFWQAQSCSPGPCGVPGTFLDSSNLTNLYEASVQIATPEPTSLAILGVGLAGLGVATRRRRSR